MYIVIVMKCHMSFDYLLMCATAGMICGIGLLDDNVVLVVASMLGFKKKLMFFFYFKSFFFLFVFC